MELTAEDHNDNCVSGDECACKWFLSARNTLLSPLVTTTPATITTTRAKLYLKSKRKM